MATPLASTASRAVTLAECTELLRRHRPAGGGPAPLDLCAWYRLQGSGRRGLGPKCREQAPARGAPIPCQHPHAQPAAWPRIRWRGVLPACARRQPSQSSRVVGSSTWMVGLRVLCQGQPEASRSHGRRTLLYRGWPFPSSLVEGPGLASLPAVLPGLLRPAWGSDLLRAASEELAGKPTARVHGNPSPSGWGSGPRSTLSIGV